MRYGLRRVLLVCIMGFTICSLLCGIATSMPQMVAFRAMQGAFGASLIPLSQVTLLQEFPRQSYARIMAIWATASMVGPIIGPTLGGYLTDQWSWRWAFYINLPIGVLAWLGIAFSMPKRHGAGHRPFDMTGFILLSLAIGLLQLMLDRGQTKDWFSSPEIVAELFFSALSFYMFLAHSFTSRHPFVDLHLFRDRNFTMCLLIQGTVGAFVMSPSVLLPVFLQQLQGYTPAQAGVLMATRGASAVVAMMVVSRLPPRIDVRYTMLSGVLMMAIAMWWMATFSIDTPASYFVVAGLVLGFGMPMTFIPTQLIAFATLPEHSRTEAGVLLRLAVNVGGSIGISLVVAQLARSAQMSQSYLSENFTAYSFDRWQIIGAAPGANVATEGLVGEVTRQALALAYSNDFHLLAATSLLCVPLILMMRRVTQSGETPSAADLSH
jgi:DHA2 family multidrug resistance protein